MTALAGEPPEDHDLAMDWSWVGDESDEEAKLRAETRKILELPELPISATCVRVPVMVGHSEAVWVELERPIEPDEATAVLREAPSVRVLDLPEFPTPAAAAGGDEVLVGRIRRDGASPQRPRPLPLVRQPAQGGGPQRDPDRRAAARGGRADRPARGPRGRSAAARQTFAPAHPPQKFRSRSGQEARSLKRGWRTSPFGVS